jgi:hypothetical protein
VMKLRGCLVLQAAVVAVYYWVTVAATNGLGVVHSHVAEGAAPCSGAEFGWEAEQWGCGGVLESAWMG